MKINDLKFCKDFHRVWKLGLDGLDFAGFQGFASELFHKVIHTRRG
jgi:hypothetical protein